MLKIEDISVSLGRFGLRNVSFEVSRGEYFVLLGMSGSGKSVLLQVIAGLISARSGNICLDGRDISREKVQKRGVGLVFQDAALFPHMNVFNNIAFPLRTRNLRRRDITGRVTALAELTGTGNLIKRSVVNLSGGEKQRVALARALALEPRCLLLDEPLSSLDVQLRGDLRALLRELNSKGQTIVHVTHDFEEAALLAGNIAVLEKGKIVQSGSPAEVFQRPRSEFVARFAGIRNFFRGELVEHTGTMRKFRSGRLEFSLLSDAPAGEGFIMIRAEDIILSDEMPHSSAVNNFMGMVVDRYPARMGTEIIIDIGVRLAVLVSDDSAREMALESGRKVWVSFKASAIKFINR